MHDETLKLQYQLTFIPEVHGKRIEEKRITRYGKVYHFITVAWVDNQDSSQWQHKSPENTIDAT